MEGVGEAGDLHGELLLEGVALLHAETSLVLVLLLPVGVLGLPLADGALQVDLHLPQLLDLHHQGLDVPLQGGDLRLRGIAAEKKDVKYGFFYFTEICKKSKSTVLIQYEERHKGSRANPLGRCGFLELVQTLQTR